MHLHQHHYAYSPVNNISRYQHYYIHNPDFNFSMHQRNYAHDSVSSRSICQHNYAYNPTTNLSIHRYNYTGNPATNLSMHLHTYARVIIASENAGNTTISLDGVPGVKVEFRPTPEEEALERYYMIRWRRQICAEVMEAVVLAKRGAEVSRSITEVEGE